MQDPTLLSTMDPAQIAAAVQHCPIPLDSALQVSYQVTLLYCTFLVIVGEICWESNTASCTCYVNFFPNASLFRFTVSYG